MTRATYRISTQYRVHWKADDSVMVVRWDFTERKGRHQRIDFEQPDITEQGELFFTKEEAERAWNESGYGWPINDPHGRCPVEVRPCKI